MTRVIVDLVFIVVVLTWIVYGYMFAGMITMGEFFIALMVNYVGARVLLWTDLQYALLIAEYNEGANE